MPPRKVMRPKKHQLSHFEKVALGATIASPLVALGIWFWPMQIKPVLSRAHADSPPSIDGEHLSRSASPKKDNASNLSTAPGTVQQNNNYGTGAQYNLQGGSFYQNAFFQTGDQFIFAKSEEPKPQEASQGGNAEPVDSESVGSKPSEFASPVSDQAPPQTNNSYGGNQYNLQNSTLYSDPARVSAAEAGLLVGNWIGTYECGRSEGQLSWTISYVAGHVQITEVSHRTLLHKVVQTTMTYKATWANPDLQIESTSGFHYTASLRLSASGDTLSGLYYSHFECSRIFLRKNV